MIDAALQAVWTPSDEIHFELKRLQGRVQDLSFSTSATPPTDSEKADLALLQTNISSLLVDVNAYRVGGDKMQDFYKQKSVIAVWDSLIKALTEDSFLLKTYIRCGTLFNQNRQVAVRLLLTDRLPLFEGANLTPTEPQNPFVTVRCASPFTVSAGIEFSFLSTSTFGIVPSGASGDKAFGITDSAQINPLPIAMVHGRIHEGWDHNVGLFASFGVAAHVQGSSSGGSSAEYLTGFSLALLRTMYLTVGWHVGKVSSLSGGYKVGDAVPAGVTVVPVTSSYQSHFGLAITFSKP